MHLFLQPVAGVEDAVQSQRLHQQRRIHTLQRCKPHLQRFQGQKVVPRLRLARWKKQITGVGMCIKSHVVE